MTRIATPDDLAGRRVQSREQGQGSMARMSWVRRSICPGRIPGRMGSSG
jgi:hypothetical protein